MDIPKKFLELHNFNQIFPPLVFSRTRTTFSW